MTSGSLAAAYIELNAVRAGIVRDPKDYRFCSYAEAVGGDKRAREGIAKLMVTENLMSTDWDSITKRYRKLFYAKGAVRTDAKTGEPIRPGFSPEQVRAIYLADGEQDGQTFHHAPPAWKILLLPRQVVMGSPRFRDFFMLRTLRLTGPERRVRAPFRVRSRRWFGV